MHRCKLYSHSYGYTEQVDSISDWHMNFLWLYVYMNNINAYVPDGGIPINSHNMSAIHAAMNVVWMVLCEMRMYKGRNKNTLAYAMAVRQECAWCWTFVRWRGRSIPWFVECMSTQMKYNNICIQFGCMHMTQVIAVVMWPIRQVAMIDSV